MHSGKIAAIVLAAGFSRRMGTPKAFLKFDLQHTFLDHLVKLYQQLSVNEIVVVLNNSHTSYLTKALSKKNIQFLFNEQPERGRLHSLKLGVDAVKSCSLALIQNIDSPLVQLNTLKILINNCYTADCVIPTCQSRRGHPVLITQNIFPKITIAPDTTTLREILAPEKKHYVETSDNGILININTQELYKKYFPDY